MSDPWGVCYNSTDNYIEDSLQENTFNQFEDNFVSTNNISLPDSEQYLKALERKLSKLKNDPNILKQLFDKREECLRNLLNDTTIQIYNENEISSYLDTPITQGETNSTVQEIYRHICPMQPLSTGEIVHIVKYDQLQEQYQINENQEDQNNIEK